MESLFLIRGRKMSVFLGEEEKRAVKLDIPLTTTATTPDATTAATPDATVYRQKTNRGRRREEEEKTIF